MGSRKVSSLGKWNRRWVYDQEKDPSSSSSPPCLLLFEALFSSSSSFCYFFFSLSFVKKGSVVGPLGHEFYFCENVGSVKRK